MAISAFDNPHIAFVFQEMFKKNLLKFSGFSNAFTNNFIIFNDQMTFSG